MFKVNNNIATFIRFTYVSAVDFEQVNLSLASAFNILFRYQVTNQLSIKINVHQKQSQHWKHQSNTLCEKWSKLTIKTPKRQQWDLFGVCIINFDQIFCLRK